MDLLLRRLHDLVHRGVRVLDKSLVRLFRVVHQRELILTDARQHLIGVSDRLLVGFHILVKLFLPRPVGAAINSSWPFRKSASAVLKLWQSGCQGSSAAVYAAIAIITLLIATFNPTKSPAANLLRRLTNPRTPANVPNPAAAKPKVGTRD